MAVDAVFHAAAPTNPVPRMIFPAAPVGRDPRAYEGTGAPLLTIDPSFVNVGSEPFFEYMYPSSGFIHTRNASKRITGKMATAFSE